MRALRRAALPLMRLRDVCIENLLGYIYIYMFGFRFCLFCSLLRYQHFGLNQSESHDAFLARGHLSSWRDGVQTYGGTVGGTNPV
jgi:hypothetical protein